MSTQLSVGKRILKIDREFWLWNQNKFTFKPGTLRSYVILEKITTIFRWNGEMAELSVSKNQNLIETDLKISFSQKTRTDLKNTNSKLDKENTLDGDHWSIQWKGNSSAN